MAHQGTLVHVSSYHYIRCAWNGCYVWGKKFQRFLNYFQINLRNMHEIETDKDGGGLIVYYTTRTNKDHSSADKTRV